MIEATPWLESRCNIQQFRKAIEDDVTGSVYQAMSSDARKAHGLSPSFVICDELAQWKNRELYDNLVTGTGAVPNRWCWLSGHRRRMTST